MISHKDKQLISMQPDYYEHAVEIAATSLAGSIPDVWSATLGIPTSK